MDAHGLEPKDRMSASKKLQRDDAQAILEASSHVVVAKGKRVDTFDTDGVDEDVLSLFLGSTGNMRAPTLRVGTTTLVGFNEEAWSKAIL